MHLSICLKVFTIRKQRKRIENENGMLNFVHEHRELEI